MEKQFGKIGDNPLPLLSSAAIASSFAESFAKELIGEIEKDNELLKYGLDGDMVDFLAKVSNGKSTCQYEEAISQNNKIIDLIKQNAGLE